MLSSAGDRLCGGLTRPSTGCSWQPCCLRHWSWGWHRPECAQVCIPDELALPAATAPGAPCPQAGRPLGTREAVERMSDRHEPHGGTAVRLVTCQPPQRSGRQVLADGECGHAGPPALILSRRHPPRLTQVGSLVSRYYLRSNGSTSRTIHGSTSRATHGLRPSVSSAA